MILAIIPGFLAGWLVIFFSDVLPHQRRLSQPECRQCNTVFAWQDYFTLHSCRQCHQRQPYRSYITLVVATLISIVLWLYSPPHLGYWPSLLILTYFGVVLIIDLEHRLILHPVSLVGIAIGLFTGILRNGLVLTLVGGLAGLIIMLSLYLLGMAFAKYRARRLGTDDNEEALGFGDVALSTVVGLMVGWPQITTALVIAIVAGGLVSLVVIIVLSMLRRFESMNVFIAYGPYLILGATLLLFLTNT